MKIKAKIGRLWIWGACIAILVAPFLPQLIMAAAKTSSFVSIAMEICSAAEATPMITVHVRKAEQQAPAHGNHSEDCPYCRVHADKAVLPVTAETDPFLRLDLFPLPSLFYQTPRPLFAWGSAQPRSPPAHF